MYRVRIENRWQAEVTFTSWTACMYEAMTAYEKATLYLPEGAVTLQVQLGLAA